MSVLDEGPAAVVHDGVVIVVLAVARRPSTDSRDYLLYRYSSRDVVQLYSTKHNRYIDKGCPNKNQTIDIFLNNFHIS